MNKQELVACIAIDTGVSQSQAKAMLESFEQNVASALDNGETVKLVGFGTFKTSERAARTARNPKTGAEVAVPAKIHVSFVAGKGLKEAVN